MITSSDVSRRTPTSSRWPRCSGPIYRGTLRAISSPARYARHLRSPPKPLRSRPCPPYRSCGSLSCHRHYSTTTRSSGSRRTRLTSPTPGSSDRQASTACRYALLTYAAKERNVLIHRAVEVHDRHWTFRLADFRSHRAGYRCDGGDAIREFRGKPVGHDPAVRYPVA